MIKKKIYTWQVFVVIWGLIAFSCKEVAVTDQLNVDYKNVYKSNNTTLYSIDIDNLLKMLNTTDEAVYIVNFWATWCGPCVEELPFFEAIRTTYKHKNVHVILVSLDAPKTIESRLIPFVESNKIQSTVLALDVKGNGWISKVYEEWSGSIPFTIIFSKDKKAYYERSFNSNELKQELQKFLD
ncbi:MAG: TlpA disulfide reductase family protein [Bacteroidota bacterium]|nr:TlpA disulfide reductase family protein [Bacteroidota bacterium]